jgi:hypothetical protein
MLALKTRNIMGHLGRKTKQNLSGKVFYLKSRKMSTPEILERSFVLQWHGK